jgi:hypothetical protein
MDYGYVPPSMVHEEKVLFETASLPVSVCRVPAVGRVSAVFPVVVYVRVCVLDCSVTFAPHVRLPVLETPLPPYAEAMIPPFHTEPVLRVLFSKVSDPVTVATVPVAGRVNDDPPPAVVKVRFDVLMERVLPALLIPVPPYVELIMPAFHVPVTSVPVPVIAV